MEKKIAPHIQKVDATLQVAQTASVVASAVGYQNVSKPVAKKFNKPATKAVKTTTSNHTIDKPAKSIVTSQDIVFSDKFSKSNYKNQVAKRGWDNDLIAQTINNPLKTSESVNKATGNPVINYYINETHYVAVDKVTNKVIQVADLNKDWKGPQIP